VFIRVVQLADALASCRNDDKPARMHVCAMAAWFVTVVGSRILTAVAAQHFGDYDGRDLLKHGVVRAAKSKSVVLSSVLQAPAEGHATVPRLAKGGLANLRSCPKDRVRTAIATGCGGTCASTRHCNCPMVIASVKGNAHCLQARGVPTVVQHVTKASSVQIL
jgi:hypothetical protein